MRKPLSSVLSFYFRGELLAYYAGDDEAARDHAGNDFKYWELMRHGLARGVQRQMLMPPFYFKQPRDAGIVQAVSAVVQGIGSDALLCLFCAHVQAALRCARRSWHQDADRAAHAGTDA